MLICKSTVQNTINQANKIFLAVSQTFAQPSEICVNFNQVYINFEQQNLNQMSMRSFFSGFDAISMVMALTLLAAITVSCKQTTRKQETQKVMEWHKDATIYEVNIRQYTEEGSFNAFQEHLPRLKSLGVDILWLMPIHPIGEKNRKGEMGSYYSVRDYKDVNPNFGSKEDFKALVDAVHEQGMYLILDWVANHSSWDNHLIEEHPEWYTRDSTGQMVSPYDWSDVADLDYSNDELRDYMSEALTYWVEEFDIDGYRCDVAGMVPVDFWERAVADMNKVMTVFMLAEDEAELELLDSAFHMHYGWEFHHKMNAVAQGKETVEDFYTYFDKSEGQMDPDDIKMNFLTNHDENSWNGTINERMGDARKAMAVVAWTVPGMPLIYTGQEIGIDKRLEFFKKDVVEWKDSPLEDFYTSLNELKADNKALFAGEFGGSFNILKSDIPSDTFVFKRVKDDNEVLVVTNLTPVEKSFTVEEAIGTYLNHFTGKKTELDGTFDLPAWGYRVFVK